MNPRTEPLLWIQLLGVAVLPLEALLLLLVLAGSDPGPAPGVEELLCWALGALAPALFLWRTPADVWSLLLVQIPAPGRRDLQRRLSRLQDTLPMKLLGPALGSVVLLPLLIRLDQQSALAAPLWTSGPMPRLVALLLAALLLALMLWQWQEAVQALWLLTRGNADLQATSPFSAAELGESRLSPGLPLLLPPSLTFPGESTTASLAASSPVAKAPLAANDIDRVKRSGHSSTASTSEPSLIDSATDRRSPPIEPEQAAADHDGGELDEPVA